MQNNPVRAFRNVPVHHEGACKMTEEVDLLVRVKIPSHRDTVTVDKVISVLLDSIEHERDKAGSLPFSVKRVDLVSNPDNPGLN